MHTFAKVFKWRETVQVCSSVFLAWSFAAFWHESEWEAQNLQTEFIDLCILFSHGALNKNFDKYIIVFKIHCHKAIILTQKDSKCVNLQLQDRSILRCHAVFLRQSASHNHATLCIRKMENIVLIFIYSKKLCRQHGKLYRPGLTLILIIPCMPLSFMYLNLISDDTYHQYLGV